MRWICLSWISAALRPLSVRSLWKAVFGIRPGFCCASWRCIRRCTACAPKSVSYSCVLAEEKQEEDSDEIILLEHDEVDLAELARDAFILDMDTKTLCSEDCKGLCPGCGVNLNREPCRCKKQVDPRLAKLASLLQEKE